MQHNPIISEFSLAPPHQLTHYLTLSRLRNNQQAISRSTVHLPNQQIIVNVTKTHLKHSNSQLPHSKIEVGDIREDVDACLDAIQNAYAQKHTPNGQQNNTQQPSALNHSNIREDAIHRIDSNIVMNYVNRVYKDYPIKNRFGDFNPPLFRPTPQQPNIQFRPRERASSLNRPSSKQKQFLNVTQQSRMSKRDPSLSSYKKQVINTVKRDHRQTFSTFDHRQTFSNIDSPGNKQPSIARAPQTAIKSQIFQKVANDFRYCVNCQKSILSINIDFHQRYECSNFQTLYRLSFKELGAFVDVKINRIKQQLRQKLASLKQQSSNGENKSKILTNKTIGLIEDYLRESQRGNGKQKQVKYNFFKESQNNLYSQCVELTHRLHWFQSICVKLKSEQTLTTNTSFNKAVDQVKAIQVIRDIPVMSNTKERRMLQSPAVYFHPHLHRYPKQSI